MRLARLVRVFLDCVAFYDHLYDQTQIVEALLKGGADKSIKNNEGKTALDLAERAGSDEIKALIA